ncbi:hypothetical protein DFH09DRAFT_1322346 [Mycena vulgaris]|nr:hypothetical protein DFH09DRAFT_1322346 [Mycena vulgaris]
METQIGIRLPRLRPAVLARLFAARRRVAAPIPIVASLRRASNPPLTFIKASSSARLHTLSSLIPLPTRLCAPRRCQFLRLLFSCGLSSLLYRCRSQSAAVPAFGHAPLMLACLPALSAVSVSVSVSVLPIPHPWILSFLPLLPCSSRVPLYVPRDSARYTVSSILGVIPYLSCAPSPSCPFASPYPHHPSLVSCARIPRPLPDVSAPESVSIPLCITHPASSSSVEIDKTPAHIFLFPVSL